MTLLLAIALKGALVLLLAALVVRLLRHAPASARHGVWAAAFAALLLLPLLEGVGPTWAVGLLPHSATLTASAVAPVPPIPPTPPLPPVPPAPPAPPDAHLSADGAPATLAEYEAEIERHAAEAAALAEAHAWEVEAEMAGLEAEMAGFEAEMEGFEAEMASFGDSWAVSAAPQANGWLRWDLSPVGRWLVGLWALGAFVVGLGWLGAALAARRIVTTARPETDDDWAVLAERARRLSGIEGPVRLLRTDALDVPIAWGYGRPAVVLPTSADAWDDGRREAVLLHEMAHLRRRDAWTQAIAQVAVAVHWMNPLAWWGYRRFLDAREHACDDAVIQGGARPSDYAAHLVGVARSLRRDPYALAAVAPMARCAPIEDRIVSILDAGRRRGRLGRVAHTATVVLAAGVLLPLAALQPVARTQSVEPAPVGTPTVTVTVDATSGWTPQVEPVPVAADTDSVSVARLEDEFDQAQDDLARAGQDVRRLIVDLDREGGEVARIRADALRAAETALSEIDLGALRVEAERAAMSFRAPDEARLLEIQHEALRQAEAALERMDWQDDIQRDAEEAVREALEELREEIEDLEEEAREAADDAASERSWRMRVDDRRSTRKASADTARLRSTRAAQTARATPVPPQTPRAAPRPSAAARPRAPRPDTAAFDWGAVERARAAATRSTPSW